jgi:hypothetical protein
VYRPLDFAGKTYDSPVEIASVRAVLAAVAMNTTHVTLVAAAMTLLGCSSAPERPREKIDRASEPDAIGWNEQPDDLVPGAPSLLASNVTRADVGRTFGVDDDHVPYPDTYWPFQSDGIAARWNDDSPSPVEKYMALVDPARAADAKAWEIANHGSQVPGVQSWYGHCPGWAAASTTIAPLRHAVSARVTDSGAVACADGEAGCVTFQIGDLDALAAEVYNDASVRFIGARCDTPPDQIKRDRYGRVVRDGTGCKGLNAGALVIVLSQQMRALNQTLTIDAQNDWNTDEIWNQPAYRYTVNDYEEIDAVAAANLVAFGTRTGSLDRYLWNDAAAGFVLVDVSIHWVREHGPNLTVVSGLQSSATTRFVAVLEIDRAPADPQATILGGEYIDDPSVGADRLTVPPFAWIATGPGPESLPTWVDGSSHNPYVRPSVVSELLAMSSSAL